MKKLLLVALIGLAGCSDEKYPALECTIDDSLSFTAVGVDRLFHDGGVLKIYIAEAPVIFHKLADGETCQRVPEIDWSLVKE